MPAGQPVPDNTADCHNDQLPHGILQQIVPLEETDCERQPHTERTAAHKQ